ncbi:hypothetical protein EJ08DRAFT_671754 [Tothia fuscella]|uniref:Glycosyltransferase family 2 protein n=1 Tax=Tothia fuscella TaxID=1048955 RepID=A0A9P4TWI7_9PEZI|nr:hypothetical protein EJ08DRAFT_671754 [Tothia fuscella]
MEIGSRSGVLCADWADIVHSPNFPFLFLFVFRYLRLIVHIISFHLYKPWPVPLNPSVHPSDVTVIIPTVEPTNPDFKECLTSVLANKPGAIIIVTVGTDNLIAAREICSKFKTNKIKVMHTKIANKRAQVCHAIPHVKTSIMVPVDDHVFWPSKNFLPHLLAPFEDPKMGIVGTNKRVRRFNHGYSARDFWNFTGCLYLERHNFEIRATNNIDGGVFVISGRTSAVRTEIIQDQAFINGFKNEHFFFGMFGPLNADDDNFITRWIVRNGWKIGIQYSNEAMIGTTLGTYPKFMSQCLRWVRTTWRSNSASLFTDRTVWRAQPWCVYAVYITSFFNFALFYDAALFFALSKTEFYYYDHCKAIKYLAAWIFASKLVKPFPHFVRNPGDLVWLPFYILFGYYHSLIKLYAGLTFWVTAWGGRTLKDAESDVEDAEYEDSDEIETL